MHYSVNRLCIGNSIRSKMCPVRRQKPKTTPALLVNQKPRVRHPIRCLTRFLLKCYTLAMPLFQKIYAPPAQVGGGFSSVLNFTNHVNVGVGRAGVSYGLDDKSKTFTFGPSLFPFTVSFGTSRAGVLFNIPYAGYALNPLRAVCKAVGN